MTSTMVDTTHQPRTTTSESDGDDDDDDDVDVICARSHTPTQDTCRGGGVLVGAGIPWRIVTWMTKPMGVAALGLRARSRGRCTERAT